MCRGRPVSINDWLFEELLFRGHAIDAYCICIFIRLSKIPATNGVLVNITLTREYLQRRGRHLSTHARANFVCCWKPRGHRIEKCHEGMLYTGDPYLCRCRETENMLEPDYKDRHGRHLIFIMDSLGECY